MKWLQGGSGYGFAPNSGWRNSQHAGISEQFTFASPTIPVLNGGVRADHLYSLNPSMDGYWNGVWGLFRNYGTAQPNLKQLPNGATLPFKLTNAAAFTGICPATAVLRSYDISAVLANDVLAQHRRGHHPPHRRVGGHERGRKDRRTASRRSTRNGGTLVYNPRATLLENGKSGPLHDPTAMLWVRTADLVARNPTAKECLNSKGKLDPTPAGLPGDAQARRRRSSPSSCAPPPASAWASRCATGCPRRCPTWPATSTCPGIVARDHGRPGRRHHLQQQPDPPVELRRPAPGARRLRREHRRRHGHRRDRRAEQRLRPHRRPRPDPVLPVVRGRHQPRARGGRRLHGGGDPGGVRRGQHHAVRRHQAGAEGARRARS